jgi:hypothetical protein
MFLNFELFLISSKTLTLFKKYSEINNIIFLQILLFFCFAYTYVLQLKNYNQQGVSNSTSTDANHSKNSLIQDTSNPNLNIKLSLSQ